MYLFWLFSITHSYFLLVLNRTFGVAFTNKCHVIIEHVPQAIERTGKSLFLSSEQVVEATHKKFSVFWERFKVLELEREKHGDQLLACVLEFNACNFLNKLKKHIESIHVNVHYPCKQCE